MFQWGPTTKVDVMGRVLQIGHHIEVVGRANNGRTGEIVGFTAQRVKIKLKPEKKGDRFNNTVAAPTNLKVLETQTPEVHESHNSTKSSSGRTKDYKTNKELPEDISLLIDALSVRINELGIDEESVVADLVAKTERRRKRKT